jgi:hypothetical protein
MVQNRTIRLLLAGLPQCGALATQGSTKAGRCVAILREGCVTVAAVLLATCVETSMETSASTRAAIPSLLTVKLTTSVNGEIFYT